MFQLFVAWPQRTYRFYHEYEVQHTPQHHRYHTKLVVLKA